MTDLPTSRIDLKTVLSGSSPTAEKDDHSEGMSYLESLPRRMVTLYLPLAIIVFVLLFPFYWMGLTAIKPDEQLLIRFDGGERHPVEREQQHDQDDRQRQVERHQPSRQ